MPKRDKLFADMERDSVVAVILVVQVGGMPGELQIVLETAQFDDAKQGLRPINNYIIRVLGVLEYRVDNIGTTVDSIELLDMHPLLYQHNSAPVAVFFKGRPKDVNELIIDISQAHASTFGAWRHFPEYLNINQPLVRLLESGGGLLGQMPEELAERLVKVLDKQGLEYKALKDKPIHEVHDNPMLKQQRAQVLRIGTAFFISNLFSVEELGKV